MATTEISPGTEPASPVQALLERLHERHSEDFSGEVASYIPELATADPAWFGITLVTADGSVYEVGDTRRSFTIQSISKPLTFALALEARGEEAVREHVDVEPSGEAFNSITLQPGTGIPLNPMVNAGAIATTSLIRPSGSNQPIDRILSEYSAFAGRELEVDESVYESENSTGHRNRAIAYLLKNANVLHDEVEDIVETYFRQCATLVDCRDLAVMAATLASTGVNPVTHERVLGEQTVRSVLSVMASCGMYDAAGDWLYSVGLPAKSGVAGGIIAVLPGALGIAVYSPPLDEHGNSVRGVKVCEELSNELRLHVMSPSRRPPPPVRAQRTCVDTRSRHLRPESELQLLDEHGFEVRVIELQGELFFAAGELITNAVLDGVDDLRFEVLDFKTVREIDPIVVPIISHLVDAVAEADGVLIFSDVEHHPEFLAAITELREAEGLPPVRVFRELDLALEWCEDELIGRWGTGRDKEEIKVEDHAAVVGMTAAEVKKLEAVLERRTYEPGERIYEQVGHVDEMLLVVKGNIDITARGRDGIEHRIATFSEGMTLGEVAMLSGSRRLGAADAVEEVVAWALTQEDLQKLRDDDPQMISTFFENLIRQISKRVGHLSRSVMG